MTREQEVENKMGEYSNLVVKCDLMSGMEKLAGFHEQRGRPMMLAGDTKVGDILGGGKSTALLIPAGTLNREKADMKRKAEELGGRVADEICSPLAIAEFYVSQGAITAGDRDIFIIDMWNTFTDICVMKNELGIRSIKAVHRIDFGFLGLEDAMMNFFSAQLDRLKAGLSADSENQRMMRLQVRELARRMLYNRTSKEVIRFQLSNRKKAVQLQIRRQEFDKIVKKLLSPILSAVSRACAVHQARKGKLLLSGELFAYAGAVAVIKSRMSVLETLSYKAEDTAVLGASGYSRKKHGRGSCRVIDDLDVLYGQPMKRGGFGNLNTSQQNAYSEILAAILSRKPEVSFAGLWEDVLPIYSALREDFPETDIIWDYGKCCLFEYKNEGRIKLELPYKTDGDETLKKINGIVKEILDSSIKQKGMSDAQILEEIYRYISNHYHYTKEHLPDGAFPPHAYTLETLLRHGVCHGYAISMVYIFRYLQIPVYYISGDADGGGFGGHAWNIVQIIDGSWRHFDMTWDLGGSGGNMRHLLLDDLGMKARKHFWAALNYPECA